MPEVVKVYEGARGPRGAPGPSGNNVYTHEQAAASMEWNITLPDLNSFLNVTTTDTAGTVIQGAVEYDHDDPDHVIIRFSVPISGYAYFS